MAASQEYNALVRGAIGIRGVWCTRVKRKSILYLVHGAMGIRWVWCRKLGTVVCSIVRVHLSYMHVQHVRNLVHCATGIHILRVWYVGLHNEHIS